MVKRKMTDGIDNQDANLNVDTLISGLSSDFLKLEEIRAFADSTLAHDEPLSLDALEWLADASTATSRKQVLDALWKFRRHQASERRGQCGWPDALIGFLWLKYERGDFGLDILVGKLAVMLEGSGHPNLDFEVFFELLTRLEHGEGFIRIHEAVKKLISPQRKCVCSELSSLGFSEQGEFVPHAQGS